MRRQKHFGTETKTKRRMNTNGLVSWDEMIRRRKCDTSQHRTLNANTSQLPQHLNGCSVISHRNSSKFTPLAFIVFVVIQGQSSHAKKTLTFSFTIRSVWRRCDTEFVRSFDSPFSFSGSKSYAFRLSFHYFIFWGIDFMGNVTGCPNAMHAHISLSNYLFHYS